MTENLFIGKSSYSVLGKTKVRPSYWLLRHVLLTLCCVPRSVSRTVWRSVRSFTDIVLNCSTTINFQRFDRLITILQSNLSKVKIMNSIAGKIAQLCQTGMFLLFIFRNSLRYKSVKILVSVKQCTEWSCAYFNDIMSIFKTQFYIKVV